MHAGTVRRWPPSARGVVPTAKSAHNQAYICGGGTVGESSERTPLLQRLGIQIAQIGLLCLFFSVFFGLAMLFYWHANDVWPNWSALDVGWSPPAVGQPSMNKLLEITYKLPIGAVASILGLLLIFVGAALSRR
jgi:hypothetical protein